MSTFDDFVEEFGVLLTDEKALAALAWNAALDAVTDLADSWRQQYDSASSSDEIPTGHDCAEDLERRIDALLTCQPQLAEADK